MSDQENGGSGAFWFGFLLGACAGAVTAWLLMPEEGTAMRPKLAERGIELKGRVEIASEEAARRAEELRRRAESLQEQGRITLEQQRSRMEEALNEGREAARKRREELAAQEESAEETT